MSESAPPPVNPYQTTQPLSPSDEKLWATLVHVGGIFFSFIPSLIGYLVLKDRGPLIRQHTVTALNFQLTLLIVFVVGMVTSLILVGVLILLAASVLNVVLSIVAALAANRGETYEYPLTIKFVR
ncbi:MAG: DUF4870 domain-containing protein [Lacisediminihabitans sp.]